MEFFSTPRLRALGPRRKRASTLNFRVPMSDEPRSSKLGPHGGPRHPKTETAGQGHENSDITLRPRGTGRAYVLARLERDERFDLIEGIKQRQISCFAAGVEAGYFKRRPTGVIDGEHNKTKLRAFGMAQVLGRVPENTFTSDEIPCFACRNPCAWK